MATGANETTASAILKQVYPKALENQINNECALWALLQKQTLTQAQGKQIAMPLRTARTTSIGVRASGEALPTPKNQTMVQAIVNLASTYFTGQIAGETIRRSDTDDAAFINALDVEMRYGMDDLVNDLGRQLFGGPLAYVNADTTTAATFVASTGSGTGVFDVSRLQVGQVLQIFSGSTEQSTAYNYTTGAGGNAITAINPATGVVTLGSASLSLTAGAKVYLAGNVTSTGTQKEMYGLDFIIDNLTDYAGATYFGLDRSTATGSPILQGNRSDASGTLTEAKMQTAVSNARKVGGGQVDLIVTDYTGRDTYAGLMTALKRYPLTASGAPVLSGGFEQSRDLMTSASQGLMFDGLPVIASRQAPLKKMFFVDMDSMTLLQQSEVSWITNGDSILHPLLSTGLDAYEFSLYYDAQLWCDAPNRNSKMVNVY